MGESQPSELGEMADLKFRAVTILPISVNGATSLQLEFSKASCRFELGHVLWAGRFLTPRNALPVSVQYWYSRSL